MDIFDSVINNDIEAIKKYIADGNDINVTDTFGNSLLHYASYRGNHPLIHLLFDAGINVNARSILGSTALFTAVLKNDRATVQLLTAIGLNINHINDDHGGTLLHLFAALGRLDCVQTLLEIGIDTTILNLKGKKAIDCVPEGYNAIIRLLEAHEAKTGATH
ncbi:MAG: hypothetical protein RLY40_24 [Pseudomonadota bacterium]